MSKTKKPNLTIEIEEPNDLVNSSYDAPLPVVFTQQDSNHLLHNNSTRSIHSNASNKSDR